MMAQIAAAKWKAFIWPDQLSYAVSQFAANGLQAKLVSTRLPIRLVRKDLGKSYE